MESISFIFGKIRLDVAHCHMSDVEADGYLIQHYSCDQFDLIEEAKEMFDKNPVAFEEIKKALSTAKAKSTSLPWGAVIEDMTEDAREGMVSTITLFCHAVIRGMPRTETQDAVIMAEKVLMKSFWIAQSYQDSVYVLNSISHLVIPPLALFSYDGKTGCINCTESVDAIMTTISLWSTWEEATKERPNICCVTVAIPDENYIHFVDACNEWVIKHPTAVTRV